MTMRKNEFLRSLRRRLRRYPSAEVDEALAYYEELIADKMECGKTEAQAVAEFGDVALVAASIAGELDGKYRANGVQTPVSSKRRHSVAYWIFKPFAVLFGLIAILVIVVLWLSFLISALALYVSALSVLVVGIIDVFVLYAGSGLYPALAGGGAVLAATGVLLLFAVFFQWLTRCSLHCMSGLCRTIFRRTAGRS